MTITLVGDCLEDATLHIVVYKFQSERGVHMHPPAYGPVQYNEILTISLVASFMIGRVCIMVKGHHVCE